MNIKDDLKAFRSAILADVQGMISAAISRIQASTPVLTLEFGFDTLDGSALTAGGWCIIRIDFPCQIIGAYLYGDVASASTLSLALGTSTEWPRNTPISPSGPFSLVGLAYNPLSVAGWKISLQPADVLVAQLVSVGSNISHALLAVAVVRMPMTSRSVGTSGLTDIATDRIVDSLGNTVVQRN